MEKTKAALKLLRIAGNNIKLSNKEYLSDELRNISKIDFDNYTDDEEVKSILIENELYKPEKMVSFLIESLFSALDSISSQIETIKVMIVSDAFAILRSVEDELEYVRDNPSSKVRKYMEIQRELGIASGKLKEHICVMISQIRDIDKQDRWEFFKRAKNNKIIMDTNMNLIRKCIDALESVVGIQICIAKELDDGNTDSIISSYKKFYNNELLVGDTCRLLQNYEFKDKSREQYFLRLRDKVDSIDTFYEGCNEYILEYSDVLDGYDNAIL